MRAKPLPSKEELVELFNYNPESGELFSKVRFSRKILAGSLLNCRNAKGYLHFNLNGRFYYAHRIIWKLVTGEEPNIIDHINGTKWDNRISNLRSVNLSQNNLNHIDAVGYYVDKRLKVKKYIVEVQGRYIGAYEDPETAKGVYFETRERLGGF